MNDKIKDRSETASDEAAHKLAELTHAFYKQHAQSFSSSRQSAWPAWHGLSATKRGRVLDLGCGNGRFLKFMRASWDFAGTYAGLDVCADLLDDAAAAHPASDSVMWCRSDVLRDAWPPGPFDLVVAWGLFHHVAGSARRRALLLSMADVLAPGGTMAVSLWQFRKHMRFSQKEIDPIAFGIDPSKLEAGDALLDWGDDRSVARYCHHFSDDEVAELRAEVLSLRPELRSRLLGSGGEWASDRYNAYLVFSRLAQ